nr:unnamed protein product [Callosobruchus analis]
MMSQKIFPNHHCELKKKATVRGLKCLPPNASRWMKFKRWIRTLSLLNETNIIVRMTLIAQVIPFISFFFTGYIVHKTNTIVIEAKDICKHYLRTFFVPDLVALVGPLAHSLAELSISANPLNQNIEFVLEVVILCCYLVRLPSVRKTMQHLFLAAELTKATTFVIGHLLTMSLLLHLLTALVIGIPMISYKGHNPDESWFKQANMRSVVETGIISYYSEGLSITCCYFFGVAHNAFNITMPNEEVTLFLVSLLGRLYTLYMIAETLRLFGLVNISEDKYENVITQMNDYIKSKNMPPHLRFKILSYCKYRLQGAYFNERQMLQTLSSHIRTELYLHFAKKLLISIPVFRLMSKRRLGALLADMQNVDYSPGDKIIQAGDPMEFVHFINSGTVAVYDGDLELFHYEDGDSFGDVVVTVLEHVGDIFQCTYLAVEYTDIYKLRKDRFRQLLQENEDLKRYFELKGSQKVKKFETLKELLRRVVFEVVILCCYLVRLPSVKRTMRYIFLAAKLPKAATLVIGHFFTMSMLLHLLTALVIGIPVILYKGHNPDESWFKQAKMRSVVETGIIL